MVVLSPCSAPGSSPMLGLPSVIAMVYDIMPQRLNFSDSWHRLQKLQLQPAGPVPRPRDEPPRWDDPAPSGLRFHQQLLADLKLSHLSLPFTFISRSEFKQCTFRGSDLSGSVCHWNDFIQVDFTKT
ncbi:MAG TPA: hypothetical protein VF607_01990, partial [Verrucomicrobiae bacterium]